MGTLELRYDLLGNRLAAIGAVPIRYDPAREDAASQPRGPELIVMRPSRVGEWDLDYDPGADRLRRIGPAEVGYDQLGNRPSTVAAWALDYDRLGSRLRQIGPYELTYDRLGNRVRRVGPLAIGYDGLGARPADLGDELLLALFVVLYLDERRREKARP